MSEKPSADINLLPKQDYNLFDIVLKGTLKKEKKVLQTILLLSVAAIGLGFVFEFGISSDHSNFFSSLALGLAGSGIVSYIVLYMQFQQKKKDQLDAIGTCLYHACGSYEYDVLNSLKFSYRMESETGIMSLLRDAQAIEKNIDLAFHYFDKADFDSLCISEILHYYGINLKASLFYFEAYCQAMLEIHRYSREIEKEKLQDFGKWILQEMKKCCPPKDLQAAISAFSAYSSEDVPELQSQWSHALDDEVQIIKGKIDLCVYDHCPEAINHWFTWPGSPYKRPVK